VIAIAAVAIAAASFDPPLDRPLVFETEQVRFAGEKPLRFGLRRELRFQRIGAGFRVVSRIVDFSTDAPPAIAGPFTAMLAGMRSTAVTLDVDPYGEVTEVHHAGAVWESILAGVDRALAARSASASDKDALPALHQFRAGMAALSPEAQRLQLLDGVEPALGGGVPLLQPGQTRAYTVSVLSPAGTPVVLAGDVRVETAPDGGRRMITLASSSGPEMAAAAANLRKLNPAKTAADKTALDRASLRLAASRMEQRITTETDPKTGLLRSRRIETTIIEADGSRRPLEVEVLRQTAPVS
jgi:hypothetical protein